MTAKVKKEDTENTNSEPKKEDTAAPVISEDMPTWQRQMWMDYTDDYSKQISQVCYDKEFKVLYNDVKVKGQDALLFTEPEWIPAVLVKKNMSTLQTEHCNDVKSEWIKLTRQAAMTPQEYSKNKLTLPPNYMDLADDRQALEKRYYEEASRIMFKLKIGNDSPREMNLEDYYRLERVNMKFAVDAVQLSISKPQPKKAEISPSLYT